MRESRAVQVTLMGVLIGIGLPIAITVVAEQYTVPLLLAVVAYVIQALNFFHGKISTLDDVDYTMLLQARPRLSLFDYVFNMMVTLAFVVIGVVLADPIAAIWANVALRAIDAPLVFATMRVSIGPAVLRAQKSWLVFDLVTLAMWLVLGFVVNGFDVSMVAWIFGITYLFVAVADIVMDYTFNSDLYFQRPNLWDSYADAWDEIQGELGDTIHRAVLAPNLLGELHNRGINSVIDIGSGNGSLARNLAGAGVRVLGVDRSVPMVRAAESYGSIPGLTFRASDIQTFDAGGEHFAAVLVVLTHHHIGDLTVVFDAASRLLDGGGVVMIVGEDLEVLDDGVLHGYTRRRWLDRATSGGARRQLLYWFSPASEAVLAVTEVTQWSSRRLQQTALASGFVSDSGSRLLLPESPLDSLTLRRYAAKPFYRLWVFRREV